MLRIMKLALLQDPPLCSSIVFLLESWSDFLTLLWCLYLDSILFPDDNEAIKSDMYHIQYMEQSAKNHV